MKKITFIFLVFCLKLFASQEYTGDSIRISDKYYSGQFLIYDCASKHWTCVDEDNLKECLESKKVAITDNEKTFPCIYFEEYDTIKKCNAFMQTKVNAPDSKRFCHNKAFKK